MIGSFYSHLFFSSYSFWANLSFTGLAFTKDLNKCTRDLKHFTSQVPFHVALLVNYDKISKLHESGTWNHNCLVLTLFYILIFLNFPLSESWFCSLSRRQINGSWFYHQRLWVLLTIPIGDFAWHVITGQCGWLGRRWCQQYSWCNCRGLH